MKQQWMQLALAASLAAGLAAAQTAPAPGAAQQGRRGVARPAMVRARMMRALNLTDAQKQQAKSIFQAARQNSQALRDQIKQSRESLNAAVKANDSAQIQALSSSLGALQGQALAISSAAQAKFYGILTPDQRAKLDEMQQKLRQRMQGNVGANG